MNKTKNKLWTKSFTLFVTSAFIEFAGSAGISFVLSLMVLDLTSSVVLYGAYLVVYYFSCIFVPVFVGPVIERRNKRNVCLTCGLAFFITCSLYCLFGLNEEYAMYIAFAVAVFLGIFNGIYAVAANAMLLEIVDSDNLQKAYSVYGAIEKCAEIVIPIVTLIYKMFSLKLVLIVSVILFFIAILFIFFVKTINTNLEQKTNNYKKQFKDGLSFVLNNKAFLYASILFMLTMATSGSRQVIWVPLYKSRNNGSELWYFIVAGVFSTGMFHSSIVTYLLKIKKKYNYLLSSICFLIMTIGSLLIVFASNIVAAIIGYFVGLCFGIFNNLKASTVLNKLDDDQRSRFLGFLTTFSNAGNVLGMGLCTILSKKMLLTGVNVTIMSIVLVVFVIVNCIGNKKIKELYNR